MSPTRRASSSCFEGRDRGEAAEWCRENNLDRHALVRASEMRGQLARYLRRFGPDADSGGAHHHPFSSCGDDTIAVRRAVVAGFFAHAARLTPGGEFRTVRGGCPVVLHPASVLATFGAPPEFVCYHDHVMVGDQARVARPSDRPRAQSLDP